MNLSFHSLALKLLGFLSNDIWIVETNSDQIFPGIILIYGILHNWGCTLYINLSSLSLSLGQASWLYVNPLSNDPKYVFKYEQ